MRNCLAGLCAALCLTAPVWPAPVVDLDAALEAVRQEIDRPGFSGAVVVLERGETRLAEVRGLADQSAGRRNTLETRFNIASVGKFLTGLAFASASETVAGPPDDFLDLPAGSLLPGDADLFDADVTAGDLMGHRTTIVSFGAADGAEQRMPGLRSNADVFELVREAQDVPVSRRRDGLAYNNSNAIVLGEIIAALHGQSYEAALRDLVLAPAGADNAVFARQGDADALGLALPYVDADFDMRAPMRPRGGGEAALPQTYPRLVETPLGSMISSAAGGLYISAPELAAVGRAALDGTLTKRDRLDRMCESLVLIPGRIFGHACGGVELAPGIERWGHNGGAPGINAELALYPQLDVVLVVLSNHNGRAGPVLAAFEAALVEQRTQERHSNGFIIRGE